MKAAAIAFLFLLSNSAYSFPKKLEVIFLAPSKVASLIKSLEHRYIFSKEKLAQDFKCVPMGEGCFHPQLGFVESKDDEIKKKKDQKKVENLKLKTFNSSDVNVVDCKKGNFFDIFCGKSGTDLAAAGDMEIWVDISSSMKRVDFSEDPSGCSRRVFVDKMISGCPKGKLSISLFDTSRKHLGKKQDLCLNHGLNDQKRIMKWIETSKAKHLLIITDIDELSPALRTYLVNEGAVMHGGDYGDFDGRRLISFADSLIKSCKKL